jgi:hypothetical protein
MAAAAGGGAVSRVTCFCAAVLPLVTLLEPLGQTTGGETRVVHSRMTPGVSPFRFVSNFLVGAENSIDPLDRPNFTIDTGTPGPVAGPPRVRDRWPRVYLEHPARALFVQRALDEASQALTMEPCLGILDDFRDPAGCSLRERLRRIGEQVHAPDLDIRRYLALITFTDARHQRASDRLCGASAIAFTAPAHRVVYVCGGSWLERINASDRRRLVAMVLHEAMHTLGLGENPPSSGEITRLILRRCKL